MLKLLSNLFRLTYYLAIMLCLSAWLSQDLSKASQTFGIPCYAKLGGKYVGNLRLCTSTSAYQVLKCIQVQASKMMPHAWRGFEHVMAWCDNQWLIPSGFAYQDDLTQEEEVQVWSAIQNAKRLEVIWDDNDEHANAIERTGQYKFNTKGIAASIFGFDEDTKVPREIVGLLKRSRLDYLQCGNKDLMGTQILTTGLSFLKHLAHITKLSLISMLPTDWSSCINIQTMQVRSFGHSDVTSGIGCLRNLRDLHLGKVESIPQDFGELDLVSFSFQQSNDLELSDLVPHLAKMAKLETLCYLKNRKTNTLIPTELGTLTSLKVLNLSENHFVGSIPSELGRLVNLTSLTIIEYADFDLTRPQEVLNLGLAELVVERPQEGW